ncbi:MAG: GDSL-type esterase/lipase family protein [Candidatus Nealsonbacteria bacterium]|nr:GDSL-type esterase/lipase family protein [Candidatus Nealsonbacteria bacterium]
MAKIFIFGDSIVNGILDEKSGGWVQRLRSYLDEKNLSNPDVEYIVYNLGVSGNNTRDLLQRFEFETKKRLDEFKEETIIIFGIGVNDSQFVLSQNSQRVPLEEYIKNLDELLNSARKFSDKILFVGLTPVDEKRTTPIPWNEDKFYKNEYVKKFNDSLRSFCQENKVYFIEIFEEMIKMNYSELLYDGLHPNSEGHEKIFEIVKDYIIKHKII